MHRPQRPIRGLAILRSGRQARRLAYRWNTAGLLALATCLSPTALLLSSSAAHAQDAPATSEASPAGPRSDRPLSDPVLTTDVKITADRTRTWRVGESQYMLLEGDASFTAGVYGFRAKRALVRIDVERRPGRRIRHMMVYLDEARHIRGKGAVQADSPRLLVTMSTTGELTLSTDLFTGEVPEDAFVQEGRARIARYLASTSVRPLDVPAAGSPRVIVDAVPEAPKGDMPPVATALPPVDSGEDAGVDGEPAVATRPAGQVLFSFDSIEVVQHDNGETSVVLMGNVRVMYQDFKGQPGAVLTAERAVIFTQSKTIGQVVNRMSTEDIRGVYLEDNVIARYDNYTVRAPRVYYDLQTDKAVVLDAVLYSWDAKREIPIYVRAEKLRQESQNAWAAEGAILTTSEFAEPHLALGADRLTMVQSKDEQGNYEHRFTADGITVQAAGLPIFAWPHIAGQATDAPLRRIDVGVDNAGPIVHTQWDMFALMGQPKPQGTQLYGQVDYLGDHGPAVGLNLDYDRPDMFGQFDSYLLAHDQGEDDIAARNDIEHDGDTRGYALLRHRQLLENNWELSLEGAYVSDETFLEEFFPGEATDSKPYETSVYLKRAEDDAMFDLTMAYDVNDFQSQTTALLSPGYRTDRLPEAGYYRVATSLWEDRLTWYSTNRIGQVRIRAGEDSPADRGFTDFLSQRGFGIANANTSFEDALRASGVPSSMRRRVDSRQELQAPFTVADWNITPYVVGRVTAYDDDFEDYRGEDSNYRLWGSTGVRYSTTFSNTYTGIDNRVLNVHDIRHLFEPNGEVFISGANIESEDLPVYDTEVEGISEGFGGRVGLRNTLETQRGGEGRWRTVEWLVLNTDYIWRSEDGEDGNPVPNYFAYRPEYSTGGDHFYSDLAWMISDTLAAVGEITYDMEDHRVAEWRVGMLMQHSPNLSTFVDYTEIDVLDNRLLGYGFQYQLTRKYDLGFRHTIDIDRGGTRDIEAVLTRKFSRWSLSVLANHDAIDDNTTIGVVFVPQGLSSGPRELSPFGSFDVPR